MNFITKFNLDKILIRKSENTKENKPKKINLRKEIEVEDAPRAPGDHVVLEVTAYVVIPGYYYSILSGS